MSQFYVQPTQEDVLGALAELGDSPDEIATALYDNGVYGDIKSSEGCPLNVYLEDKFPGTWFKTSGSITIGTNTATPKTIKLPDSIAEFVVNLDAGEYSFLASY